MEPKRKSKGIYWWLDVTGLEGQPIPKKLAERRDVQDFLDWYNNLNSCKYVIRDKRPQNEQEKPDAICSNDSAEWLAIEYTRLFDDPEVVARNMKEAQKSTFNPLHPGAVVRTIYDRNDVIRVVQCKDEKSFVNIPRELTCSKKIVVVNIDGYCSPAELVDPILQKGATNLRFENVTDVFLMYDEAYCDVTNIL